MQGIIAVEIHKSMRKRANMGVQISNVKWHMSECMVRT